MKVKVTGGCLKKREVEIENYFVESLDGYDYERGAVESAARTAENGTKALGRLCDLLVSKNVLSLSEIVYIANGYDAEQLEKVEERR